MIKVAILWHMHQPYYEDLATGEHVLPWVRLHALKDYFGMVALLREFPSIRLTFNLVPSLLVQLQAFAENRARDRHLELGLKPAEQLTEDDQSFILANFFHAHRARMIDPYPRYRELLATLESTAHGHGALTAGAQAGPGFSTADLRDLQVWHKLAWVDPGYLAGESRVRALVEKDRGFSEDDKLTLRQIELEILQRIVPEYRGALERGQVELSASPFYHPILPLLCDTDVYLQGQPHGRLPRHRFRHPEDAAEQLSRAADYHARVFGQPPVGLWPPEGSVSEAIVPLVRNAGFDWLASDEMILSRTLNAALTRDGQGHLEQPELLYRPYRIRSGGADVSALFRDHHLSDLIGFTYSSWDPDAAARDFVDRLQEAGKRFAARTNGADATIPIVLDGENAWEHYEGGGRSFLRALYARLAAEPGIKTVTCRDACESPEAELGRLFPGSWINADFYIWIGHPDDHRAWAQLADAREMLARAEGETEAAALARAREEVLIAEGSDWFWWYGDDHSSAHDRVFDDLFRRHLRNTYRALKKTIPEELFVTNISTSQLQIDSGSPLGFVHPTIDGEDSSYFEWIGAALLDDRGAAGTMSQSALPAHTLLAIRFGFDRARLYVRADVSGSARDVLAAGHAFVVSFLRPAGLRLRVVTNGDKLDARLWARQPDGHEQPIQAVEAVAGSILEVALPLEALMVKPGDTLGFSVALWDGEIECERFPSDYLIEATVPTEDFEAVNWTA